MKYSLIIVCVVVFTLDISAGIRCFHCNNVESNSECKEKMRCRSYSQGCQNIVRVENGLLSISKGCAQRTACLASSGQNKRQCQPTVLSQLQSNKIDLSKRLPVSRCTSCCNTDLCNRNAYLFEESRPGMKDPKSPKSWRRTQPPIRDVRVITLTPSTAVITFKDIRNNTARFWTVKVIPSKRSKVVPVLVRSNEIPGVNFDMGRIPEDKLVYLARDLIPGTQYRLVVYSRRGKSLYTQRIYNSFVTKPRPPSNVRLTRFDTTSLNVFVSAPRGNGRVSSYGLSYRKASDPISAEVMLPTFNEPGVRRIHNLMPGTEYIVSVWTTVLTRSGHVLTQSERTNLTVFTAIPEIIDITASHVHSTNITWSFRIPGPPMENQEFVVTVRDASNGVIVRETTMSSSKRSYTAKGLTPETPYTFSVKASANGRESPSSTSEPTTTLVRCYSCWDAGSRDECEDYIECLPNAGGCLNEIRRHTITNDFKEHPAMYRATLKCKQVKACNNSELQDRTDQCNPDRNRNVDPPDVCRCCCEGDLCNGPGSLCGHLLGWLVALRDTEIETFSPVFCDSRNYLEGGFVTCSSENEIGSECSFRCRSGAYLSGPSVTTCNSGGDWSEPLPECVPLKDCQPLIESEGIRILCTEDFQPGSSCTISCELGYALAGESPVTCLRSGEWREKNIAVCVQKDDCQPNPCANNAACDDLTNDFECACLPGWTGKICDKEVFCEVLQVPEHGSLQCTKSNTYGSICRYECDEGYEQHGTTFSSCLFDGFWSSIEPTLCVIRNCPVPAQTLINGGITNCTGFEVGDTCTFTCPRGLTVAGGASEITCQPDSTWSDNIPCCDLQCPPHALVDILFLLDSSSSVGKENWATLINFTIALLDQFVIGPDDMRVGAARYNKIFDKESEILVGDYTSVDELKEKLRDMPYRGSGTLTGKALWNLHNDSLNAPGNRPGVPDVIVIITDGLASDRVQEPAQAIKDKQVKIYVVGVINRFNRVHYGQLRSISSGEQYLQIITEGYTQLARDLSQQLTRDVCWLPCDFKYEQREIVLRNRQLAVQQAQPIEEQFWSQFYLNHTSVATPVDPIPYDPIAIDPPLEQPAIFEEIPLEVPIKKFGGK